MALAKETLENAARCGYAARGIVYLLVGGLSLLAAIGAGGMSGGSTDALRELMNQPFGGVLLAVVAAGLLAFALWRLVEALSDADGHGTGAKGLAVRGAHLVSSALHFGLAAWAIQLSLGIGSSGGGGGAQDWTRWLLSQPFGPWLVAAAGIAVVVAGGAMLVRAWTAAFRKRLRCGREEETWLIPLGRAGYAARGVTFLIVGALLVLAAWTHDPSAAKGLGGALQTLREQPYGWALLALVSAGLFAFGAFAIAQAFYRRIDPPEPRLNTRRLKTA
jgi:hypothetical protein